MKACLALARRRFIVGGSAFFGLFFTPFFSSLFGQNQPPVLTNISSQIDGASKKMNLEFDLFDAENDSIEVVIDLSSNGGQTFDLSFLPKTGDFGWPIFSSISKKVVVDLTAVAASLPPEGLVARISVFDRQPFDFLSLVAAVDSQRLKQEMAFVIGKRHRTSGLAHLQDVQDSLKNLMKTACLGLQTQLFSYPNYQGQNIIGKHRGISKPSSVYIIDAHYDTVANSPGGDDNGTGTIGMMESVRVLSRFPCRNSVFFIGFDLEETGLTGSKAFNATGVAATDTIDGVFNFEMIGYLDQKPNTQQVPAGFGTLFPAVYAALEQDSFRGNFVTNVSNAFSGEIETAFNDAASAYVPSLKVRPIPIPSNWQSPFYSDLTRSDHASFWAKNRPAVMLTDGAEFRNDCYHTAFDTAGAKLNYTFLAGVVRATVAATAKLAGAEHGSWALTACPLPTISTTDFLTENAFRVWPNPTDGELFFEVEKSHAGQSFLLQLIDNQGVTIFSKTIFDEKKVSLAGLSSGLFTVRAVFEKGETWTQKVVLR